MHLLNEDSLSIKSMHLRSCLLLERDKLNKYLYLLYYNRDLQSIMKNYSGEESQDEHKISGLC